METSRALRLQAAYAIAENVDKDALLQSLINKANDDDTVVVDLETLRSLRVRINSDSLVMQKQDQKITKLENDLFNNK